MFESDCAVCGATCMEPGMACRECHASPQWQDLFQASRVAKEQCASLLAHSLLEDAELRRVNELLSSMHLRWSQQMRQNAQPPADCGMRPCLHCRICGRPASVTQKFCTVCGGPTGPRSDHLRHMDFVLHLITNHIAAEMPADRAQRCVDEFHSRIARLEAELKLDAPAESARPAAALSALPRRTIAEILLDPQSIRWLLGSGGALLTVGLVIFLSSLGLFRNAMVVASAMGVGTLSILAGGIATIRFTRHRLAGKALALLGCLVLPLNLWFYNAHRLITIDGHLWVAAMAGCVLYALAAFVLEDPMFVYVLFGGITMTGMLVLADLHQITQASAPAALLVSLGLISLHAERAFADDDGPFSRQRFGLACFWSAHAMVGLGLMLLLGSQFAAWGQRFGFSLNVIDSLTSNQFLTLGLVLAGGYGYAYSSLIVHRKPIYGYAAVACVLWAELLGVQIGHLTAHLPPLLFVIAATSLAMNFASALLTRRSRHQQQLLAAPLSLLGVGLTFIALSVGLLPHLHAVLFGLFDAPRFTVTWTYVLAMAWVAATSRVAASLNARRREKVCVSYLVAAAGGVLISAVSALTLIGLNRWPIEPTVLMAIPMLYLVGSRFHRNGPIKQALPALAGATAVILIFSDQLLHSSQWLYPLAGQAADVWTAGFCLESAAFFAMASAFRRGRYNVFLAAAMICGTIYQLLAFWELPPQSFNIAIALSGVIGLTISRILDASGRRQIGRLSPLAVCSNALVSLPTAGVMFMNLSRLASGRMDLSMLWTPAILIVLGLIAALLASAGNARRWYFVLTLGQVAVGLLTLEQYSTLTVPRKLELFSVMGGLVLLIVGYRSWYREQSDWNQGANLSLLFGSLLAGLPPAIFAVANRFGDGISFADELGLLTVAVLMFLTGMMSRIRATTLIGGGLLTIHLIILVIFAGMKAQLALGAYVAIGGASLFLLGLLLSVYRDRLLTLPQRIKHRQGLFSVLAWR